MTFRLIERLAEFPELDDLSTKGRSTEELNELVEIFKPLNAGGFSLVNNVPNKHKLYSRVVVKVNDIKGMSVKHH